MSRVIEQGNEVVVEEGEEEVVDLSPRSEPEEIEVSEEGSTEEIKTESEIPDKFKDKSIEDVVKSYSELEKEFGRRNNELGELRKINQQLLELQLNENTESQVKEQVDPELDIDSLLDDPANALSKAIENNPKLKQIEESLQQAERSKAQAAFESKHPNAMNQVGTEEFQKWIQEDPTRLTLFQDAHVNYDYAKADTLFTWYEQTHQPQQTDTDSKELKKAAVESGGPKVKRKKIFRKADLMHMRTHDRDRFESMQDEIIKAYAEGRVR